MPADLPAQDASEWIIQQAAIWPDLARGLKGPGMRREYHHRSWHFIDLPDFLTPADEQALKDQIKNHINLSFEVPSDPDAQKSMNIMQAIAHSRSILFDPQAKPQDRALHLSWLIHLVGDLHQPLHTTALFSRHLFPVGDQGGNKIPLSSERTCTVCGTAFPAAHASRQPRTGLSVFWRTRKCENWVSGPRQTKTSRRGSMKVTNSQ